jgi:transposase
VITQEDLMDIRALHRLGLPTRRAAGSVATGARVKRYVVDNMQPIYRRKRTPSKLDPFKPVSTGGSRAARTSRRPASTHLVRDHGFAGDDQTVRRYVHPCWRPLPPAPDALDAARLRRDVVVTTGLPPGQLKVALTSSVRPEHEPLD